MIARSIDGVRNFHCEYRAMYDEFRDAVAQECGVDVFEMGHLTAELTLEGNRARKRLVIKVVVKL